MMTLQNKKMICKFYIFATFVKPMTNSFIYNFLTELIHLDHRIQAENI